MVKGEKLFILFKFMEAKIAKRILKCCHGMAEIIKIKAREEEQGKSIENIKKRTLGNNKKNEKFIYFAKSLYPSGEGLTPGTDLCVY